MDQNRIDLIKVSQVSRLLFNRDPLSLAYCHKDQCTLTAVFSPLVLTGDRRSVGKKSRRILWYPTLDRPQPHFQSL